MPSVIDSLTVNLSLDPHGLIEGERAAINSLEKTKNEAADLGTKIEAQGLKINDVFRTLKGGALGLAAGLAGAEAVSLVDKIAAVDAATSRLSRSLNMNIGTLSTWERITEQVGGTAEDARTTFSTLTDTINNFTAGAGNVSGPFAALLNMAGIGGAGGLRHTTPETIIRRITAALEQEVQAGRMTPDRQRWWLQQIPGMSPGMLNAMMRGTRGLEELAEAARKAGIATEDSGKQAEEYQQKLALLTRVTQMLASYGITPLTVVIGVFATSLKALSDTIDYIAKKLVISEEKPDQAADEEMVRNRRWWAEKLLGPITAQQMYGDMGKPTGAGGGTRGDRNNNPGNIKYGPYAAAHGATGADAGGFAIFPTRTVGEKAMANLLHDSYRGLTLQQIADKWAEHPGPAYVQSMARATGLTANSIPDLNDVAMVAKIMRGMSAAEGTHIGAGVARAPGGNIWTGVAPGGNFGLPPVGAPATTPPAANNNRTSSLNIDTINVTSTRADPKEVAEAVPPAIKRMSDAMMVNDALV